MFLHIYTDGGSRGNPGPGAIGVVIKKFDELSQKEITIQKFGKKIGTVTNNVAEYRAVLEAYVFLLKDQDKKSGERRVINFFLDSKLVASQLNGLFKIKDARLRELLLSIRNKEADLGGDIIYQHIPREKNQEADEEVNKALDNNLLKEQL